MCWCLIYRHLFSFPILNFGKINKSPFLLMHCASFAAKGGGHFSGYETRICTLTSTLKLDTPIIVNKDNQWKYYREFVKISLYSLMLLEVFQNNIRLGQIFACAQYFAKNKPWRFRLTILKTSDIKCSANSCLSSAKAPSSHLCYSESLSF